MRAAASIRVLLAMALAVPASASQREPASGVFREGAYAPAFTLPAVAGGPEVELAAYAGKRVVLLQFASW